MQSDNTEFSELEIKYDATGTSLLEFERTLNLMTHVTDKVQVEGEDFYYSQGENVVRFRYPFNAEGAELTVKVRKSKDSIQDRHEVDLPLGLVSPNQVDRFMELSGWKRECALHKVASIYTIRTPGHPDVILAYYIINGAKTFLEVEVEKSVLVSIEEAEKTLATWNWLLTRNLHKLTPIPNLSLYEYYTGKSYKVLNG